MSSLSEQDHLNPNDPAYYAPRWLRERSKSRSPSEPVRATPISPPTSLHIQLENVVSDALRHPLGPEVIHEPAGLAREDRRAALFSVGAVFAAVGVSAVVALFFVMMVPGSRQSDAEGSKPALAEFQALLASAPASQNVTHEQSEQLLQQFLQWRQKPNSTEKSQ